MSKNILKRSFLVVSLIVSSLAAQDKVDAIEAARQAKAAAEKAAADAEAATDAAIEQAAKNAAKDAREKIKQDRLDEEARKIAEAKAAEEAELDAAAAAAAEEAKRKMAEELGLEYEAPAPATATATETAEESPTTEEVSVEEEAEEVVAKEDLGWSVGAALSAGLVKGATFTGVPTGGTVVITTPFSFKVGPLDYTVSLGAGGYSGEHDGISFNPSFAGLGGNLTLADLVFAEGHVGLVGEGTGFRGFAGVSLERLMKKGLDLPFNILVGSEAFYSNDMAGVGNSSYWAALGVRLDYSF
jgi:hypothetical protein